MRKFPTLSPFTRAKIRATFAPINWIQWLTLALALTIAVTVPILFLRLQGVSRTIQQQRHASIIGQCIDQNHRHDNTIKFLEKISKDYLKTHPGQKARIKVSLADDKLLIQALAPKRDCQKLAKKFVSKP